MKLFETYLRIRKMKTVLVLYSFFYFFNALSQVRIIHDPIACSYGLKNEKNEWIVAPKYQQLLWLENNFYACQQGEKWGIIQSNGKNFLSPKYDKISVFSPGRFLIHSSIQHNLYQENKVGVLDTNANWFLPQSFRSIQRMQNNHYLLAKTIYEKNGSEHYQSSIADSTGKPLFPFVDGLMHYSFYKKPILLIGDNTLGISTVKGNVRLINHQGEVVTDEIFDFGLACGENYILTKNGRYTLFNSKGKKAVENSFYLDYQNYDYQNPIPCIHGTHQFTIIENGKKGIINGDWELIIKPQYSQINPINSSYQLYSNARYLAINAENKKFHLLGKDGKLWFEADTIFTKAIQLPKTNYYEQDKFKIYFFFGEKINNETKFGILNEKGLAVLQPKYDCILIDDNLDALLIEKKPIQSSIPTIQFVSLENENNFKKTNLNFIKKINDIYFYQQNQKIYPIQFSSQNNSLNITLFGYDLPTIYGNYTFIRGNEASFIINNKTNEIEKVTAIQLGNGQFPIVQTKKGVNLWHPTKARLFSTDFSQIFQQTSRDNRIWALNPNGKWLIYDTLGKKKVNIEFDAISYDWDTIIVQSNAKKGIIDANCNWIFKPIFKDIFTLTKKLYIAITVSNKVAVLDISQPKQIDSVYSSFKPMVHFSDKNQYYYCLEKNGKQYFFNEAKKPIQKTEKEIITEFWTNPLNRVFDFHLKYSNETVRYLNNANDIIFDYLYLFYLKNIEQNSFAVINGQKGLQKHNLFQFTIEHSSYNKLSLSINQPQNRDKYLDNIKFPPLTYQNLNFHETVNWIYRDNEWRKVKFEELFNTKNKKYQEAVIEAIQNNPNLKIDCTEPNSLMEGSDRFTFENSGIKLYFFEGEAKSFQLIITKEQIEKIPSAKWIIPFL